MGLAQLVMSRCPSIHDALVALHDQLRIAFHVNLLCDRNSLEVFIQDPPGLGSGPSDEDRDLVIHRKREEFL